MPAAGCGGKFWTATRSQLIVDVESVHVVVAVRPRQRAAAVHVQLLLHEERAVAAARRELHARRAVDGEVALLLLELEGGRERE